MLYTRRIKSLISSLSLILLALVLTACSSQQTNIARRIQEDPHPVIVWGVKADTKLMGFYNIADQELQGFDIDIAKALTEVMTEGRGRAELVEASAKTRIPLLKNSNIDAIAATLTITEERAKILDFSQVYFDGGQSLLVAAGSPIKGLESLQLGHTVIAMKGTTGAKNIRELAPQVNVLELENYAEGFVALQSKQADAMTGDNSILMGLISDHQSGDYHLTGENFTHEPYGIGVDQGQKEFLAMINQALDEIKANGIYDQIYEKWFGGFIEASAN